MKNPEQSRSQSENQKEYSLETLKKLARFSLMLEDDFARKTRKQIAEMKGESEIEYIEKKKEDMEKLDMELSPLGLHLETYADDSVGFSLADPKKFLDTVEQIMKLKDDNHSVDQEFSKFIYDFQQQILEKYDHAVSDSRLEDFFLLYEQMKETIQSSDKTLSNLALHSLEGVFQAMHKGCLNEYKILRERKILEPFPLSAMIWKTRIENPQSQRKDSDPDQEVLDRLEFLFDEWKKIIDEVNKNPGAHDLVLSCKKFLEDDLRWRLNKSDPEYKEKIESCLSEIKEIN